MTTKYIVIRHPLHAMEVLVMFPEFVLHSDFHRDYDVEGEIVSAGFILLDNGEFICHGESVSLKVKSRPEDSALANEMFRRETGLDKDLCLSKFKHNGRVS